MSYLPFSAYHESGTSSRTPFYSTSTPPAPPPKPSEQSTPQQRGPPLPPPPPGQSQGPSELYGSQNNDYQQTPRQQAAVRGPDPGWLPHKLKDKSTADLHHLLENQDLQQALLSNPATTHTSIPASQAQIQPLIEHNISLASSVQQLEQQLAQKRSQTQSRLLTLRALEQQHRSKISETEEALKQFSPMALYQRLNASVQEQDSLVKGLEDSFIDESGLATEREVSEFVRRVKEQKKTAFLRHERRERWDEGRVGGWR